MKNFVITIMKNQQSYDAAQRCIRSAAKFNIEVNTFSAVTPSDNPGRLLASNKIPVEGFVSNYSRLENVTSCFLSHWSLWRRCMQGDEPFLILEHDAIFTDPVPTVPFDKLLSIGAPSYGKFKTPKTLGVNPLTSKTYLPGAHAYILKPEGAAKLVEQARINASPTDVFLNLQNFPWLQEYYPWCVEVQDSFTTVQAKPGCLAKHNYQKNPDNYEIVQV
jgi:GR25 family glycosyltransferase involved in LPS biosynthesis